VVRSLQVLDHLNLQMRGCNILKMEDSKEVPTGNQPRKFLIAFLPWLIKPKTNSRGDKSQDQRPDVDLFTPVKIGEELGAD